MCYKRKKDCKAQQMWYSVCSLLSLFFQLDALIHVSRKFARFSSTRPLQTQLIQQRREQRALSRLHLQSLPSSLATAIPPSHSARYHVGFERITETSASRHTPWIRASGPAGTRCQCAFPISADYRLRPVDSVQWEQYSAADFHSWARRRSNATFGHCAAGKDRGGQIKSFEPDPGVRRVQGKSCCQSKSVHAKMRLTLQDSIPQTCSLSLIALPREQACGRSTK